MTRRTELRLGARRLDTVTDLARTGDAYASTTPSYWGTVAAGNTAPRGKIGEGEYLNQHLKGAADVVTPMAETVGKMFDFYTDKFGAPPSSDFRIVEVEGANWPSQWSVGMLLLSSNGIRRDFDRDAMAYSVAHQWFPLKYAVKDPGVDAWMVDGMAQFASLLYFERRSLRLKHKHTFMQPEKLRAKKATHYSRGWNPR